MQNEARQPHGFAVMPAPIQRGRVLLRHGRIALRHLPKRIAADIDMSAADPDGTAGSYEILMDYLLGCNTARRTVVMRSAIRAAGDAGKADGGPGQAAATHVRFEFPEGASVGSLPQPSDPRMHLSTLPERRYATIWFLGPPSRKRLARHGEQLSTFICLRGLMPASQPGPPARVSRSGPFRLFTEVSVQIAGWPPATAVRSPRTPRRRMPAA